MLAPFPSTQSKTPDQRDQGVDDILAILLAFSASPDELEVLLLSLTYGNVEVEKCLRNVISLFHHVENEISWRQNLSLIHISEPTRPY